MFVASLQLTVAPPNVPGFMKDKAKLKIQHDDLVNEVGRFCVGVLPQLFLKYSVDPSRIRSVLVIPQLMPLNVYVDMRMTTVCFSFFPASFDYLCLITQLLTHILSTGIRRVGG